MSASIESRITNPRSRVRIGSVSYLNARPLIYGIEDKVTLHVPSELADLMRAGQLDAGLVPIVECFAHDRYVVLEGASISCRGPVYSVLLAYRGPLKNVRHIFADQTSRTSVLLIQTIFRELFGTVPEISPLPDYDFQHAPDAMLLIGNNAIRFRAARSEHQILDLGQAWWELTKLPFVFAVWALQPAAAQTDLPAMLQKAKRDGEAHIEEIALGEKEFSADFCREFFAHHIRFDLGPEEKQGIAAFREYLQRSKKIQQVHDLRYVP